MSPSSAPGFAFSARAARTTDQPIGYLMAMAVDRPDLISLAAGLVDYESLPSEQAALLLDELLRDAASAKIPLQYGTIEGLAELRSVLLDHVARLDGLSPDDLQASARDVVVTSGSQQLLFMLGDVLLDPGDIAITAWPSYFVYAAALQTFGADVRCVDIDEGGMVPEALEALLQRLDGEGALPRVKLLYVCSYHQNPTGITLAAERRPALLDLVRRYSTDHRILVVEDAAYRELTYHGEPPPSLKRYDTGNRFVALLQTFSKPFAPGVKIGYGLLPSDLVEPVLLQKGSHDFGSANLCQHLLLAAMKQGVYARHLERLRRHYAAKRDAMLAALDEHLGAFQPAHTRWTRPSGGLYVWLTLPPGTDTGPHGPLLQRALDEGVLYVPGAYCYPPDPDRTAPTNTLRLSYGSPTIEQIREGVRRLAHAIRGGRPGPACGP
ncbi:MAG: PLP-dependent aminotransferase family protein [Candidatus Brocadiia bacterium]